MWQNNLCKGKSLVYIVSVGLNCKILNIDTISEAIACQLLFDNHESLIVSFTDYQTNHWKVLQIFVIILSQS